MSLRAIVSGVLFSAPTEKQSSKGKRYLLAKIREGWGDNARWVSAFIFGADEIEAVSRLQPGEPIAVAGALDAAIYAPAGGEPRVSWTIGCDGVLSARRPKRDAPATERRHGPHQSNREREFDDDLPF